MPYFPTSDTYLQQSLLLLQARPETTRITTKYTTRPLHRRRRKARDRNPSPQASTSQPANASSSSTSQPQQQQEQPSSSSTNPPATVKPPKLETYLVLKTYDPVSGVCLKYRTDKGAEVGRLVGGLAGCGRVMVGGGFGKEEEEVEGGIHSGGGEGKDVEMGGVEAGASKVDVGGGEGKGQVGAGDAGAGVPVKGGEGAGGGKKKKKKGGKK